MAVTSPVADLTGARAARVLPTVAVIVPSRNAAGTVAATVRALLEATGGVVTEVLVVDDASHDATREQVRPLRAEYGARVRLLVNVEGIGHGASVKRGFREHAWNAPFVAVVHADAGPAAASALLDMVAALAQEPAPDVVIDEETPIVLLDREVLSDEDVDRLADGDLFHPGLRRLLARR
jgi:glycosyltransferase involved in cell wall biosynthesis